MLISYVRLDHMLYSINYGIDPCLPLKLPADLSDNPHVCHQLRDMLAVFHCQHASTYAEALYPGGNIGDQMALVCADSSN